MMVSKTGSTAAGYLEMARRISPVAACCSTASTSRFSASAKRFSRLRTLESSLVRDLWSRADFALALAFAGFTGDPSAAPQAHDDRRQATPRRFREQVRRSPWFHLFQVLSKLTAPSQSHDPRVDAKSVPTAQEHGSGGAHPDRGGDKPRTYGARVCYERRGPHGGRSRLWDGLPEAEDSLRVHLPRQAGLKPHVQP